MEAFESYALTKELEFDFSYAPSTIIMDHDPLRLQQVLSNLLSNAIKFSTKGGRIVLRCHLVSKDTLKQHLTPPVGWMSYQENEHSRCKDKSYQSNCLHISIRDNGIGIPAKDLGRIFDRFSQLSDSSMVKEPGAGIGLALSRELVGLMGGEISLSSKPNEGSIFHVLLPIRTEAQMVEKHPQHELPELHLPRLSSIELEDELVMAAGRERILLIEDNKDVLAYLRSCLSDAYDLLMAENGKLGLEKGIEQIPDLIISDVMMPGLDGFSLCDQLKQDPRTSHIPIILLTAKGTTEDRLEGLSAGADAYLIKPFHKKELLIRVQQLLRLRKRLHARYASLIPTKPAVIRQSKKKTHFCPS